ncbi:hypothetical protein YC2023_030962 [Brassica napus]
MNSGKLTEKYSLPSTTLSRQEGLATEADILRFRNPLFPDVDFEIACDQYKESSSSKSNGVNSGFIYLKATTKPTRFCEYWCK